MARNLPDVVSRKALVYFDRRFARRIVDGKARVEDVDPDFRLIAKQKMWFEYGSYIQYVFLRKSDRKFFAMYYCPTSEQFVDDKGSVVVLRPCLAREHIVEYVEFRPTKEAMPPVGVYMSVSEDNLAVLEDLGVKHTHLERAADIKKWIAGGVK